MGLQAELPFLQLKLVSLPLRAPMTARGELRLGNVSGSLQIHQGQAENTDNILQLRMPVVTHDATDVRTGPCVSFSLRIIVLIRT